MIRIPYCTVSFLEVSIPVWDYVTFIIILIQNNEKENTMINRKYKTHEILQIFVAFPISEKSAHRGCVFHLLYFIPVNIEDLRMFFFFLVCFIPCNIEDLRMWFYLVCFIPVNITDLRMCFYLFCFIPVNIEDLTPILKKEEAPKPKPVRVGDASGPGGRGTSSYPISSYSFSNVFFCLLTVLESAKLQIHI